MIGAEVEHEGTREPEAEGGKPSAIGSAVEGLTRRTSPRGLSHRAAPDRGRRELLFRRIRVLAGVAQTGAAQQENFGVFDQAVGDSRSDGRIEEDIAPVRKGRVCRNDGRTLLTVARRDDLIEEI